MAGCRATLFLALRDPEDPLPPRGFYLPLQPRKDQCPLGPETTRLKAVLQTSGQLNYETDRKNRIHSQSRRRSICSHPQP